MVLRLHQLLLITWGPTYRHETSLSLLVFLNDNNKKNIDVVGITKKETTEVLSRENPYCVCYKRGLPILQNHEEAIVTKEFCGLMTTTTTALYTEQYIIAVVYQKSEPKHDLCS